MLRRFLIAAVALAAGVALAALPTTSGASAPASASAAAAKPMYLTVEVAVGHIASRGRATSATGTATATLSSLSGQVTRVKQRVTLAAAKGGSCRVLHLFLQKLDLTLLGLNAHLDKVNLDITGRRNGGVLGTLFCRLAGWPAG